MILRSKVFWLVAGIVFLGKLLWFAYWGTLLEVDSIGYLQFQTALYHPPGYVIFCGLILSIFKYVESIVIAQSLLFSLAFSLLINQVFHTKSWRFLAGFLIAIEPCSGVICAEIMSEALFISFLILAFCSITPLINSKGPQANWMAGFVGLMLGLSYLTRYAAPVYFIAILVTFFVLKVPFRQAIKYGFWMLFVFQLTLLPLRIYYWGQFGTLRFNAYTQLSVWNSAAYLFPDSELKSKPSNDFEQLLSVSEDSVFEKKHTWYTNHFFNGEWPFQRFTEGKSTKECLAAAEIAGRTGFKLILESPVRHVTEFVGPNFTRPFWHRHEIYSNLLGALISAPLAFQKTYYFEYQPIFGWAFCGLLLIGTVLSIRNRRSSEPVSLLLVLSSWLYFVAIGLLAVFFLRFIYLLLPIVLLAFLIQVNRTLSN